LEPAAPTPAPQNRSRTAARVAIVVVLLSLLGLTALVIWAVSVARRPSPPVEAPRFDRFERAWSSAMAKAGVEATFPAGPVEVTQLTATGRAPFEATFTAEEITALINVYPYRTDIGGQAIAFQDPIVELPEPGVGSLSGKLETGGSTYDAAITAPVTYGAAGIESPGATELTVEGFSVGGDRRSQATGAVIGYLNSYVLAAPGLTVDSAEIVDGGLRVSGFAPASIEHPAPSTQ